MDDRSKVVGDAQRIETLAGYVFPLSIGSGLVYMHSIWVPTNSIGSGLVYMHSIWVPTNDDLQQYPHVFFTTTDIWDASVLDHAIAPALLDEMNQEADNSFFRTLFLMNFDTFNNKWYSTWMCSGIQAQPRLGSILFMLTFKKAILLNKAGNHSGLTLIGNLNKSCKTHTR